MSEFKRQILQQLAKDFLDVQLLRIVEQEPTWGYRITRAFESEFGLKLRHGILYPTLNRLEKQGFFTCETQRQGGRARKTYTITNKGKQYLHAYYSALGEQIERGHAK